MNSDDVVNLAREEARAASHRQLQRALPTADAHVINRARREYVKAQHSASSRVIESLSQQENTLSTDQTSNHNTDDQEQEQQEQHPADLYPFPAHWPITGPFANTDHQE